MRTFAYSFCLAALIALAGCAPSRTVRPDGSTNGMCPAGCVMCDPQGMCHDCGAPNQDVCSAGAVYHCNGDGTLGAQVKACDIQNGQMCSNGDCFSACELAASSHSYIGCDYWPTTTLTGQLNPYFDFAVAVANPLTVGDVVQSATATITITRGANMIKQVDVMPGDVQTIILPWVQELTQQPDCQQFGCIPKMEGSALVANGAYHLVSSIPVTVYQFSPLQFEKPQTNTCIDQLPMGNKCHSYTNDASILLPTTALRNEYVAISRQTFAIDRGGQPVSIPGFIAIVGTEDNTTVAVNFTANTEAGPMVAAQAAGSKATYTLMKGMVLELTSRRATSPCAKMESDGQATYCDLGPKFDLTGSTIVSDKPIAVFGGHSCSFVPYGKWACDHLEEQITPLDTWGQKIAMVQTQPQTPAEPNVFRIVSGGDGSDGMGNSITFDPPATAMPVTLKKGQYIEFIVKGAFQVTGTDRLAVGQYMVGENYTTAMITVGDPALGLGVPVEQYRRTYDFITPETYTKSYVNVIGPEANNMLLDGMVFSGGFTPIGGTGLGFKRYEIKPGAHHITGDLTFGITVSGIANFTSYLYAGGQDLNQINPG